MKFTTAKVRKPKFKSSVENAVGILEKGFFHDLEERRYFSLDQFNEDLWEKLSELNDAPFKKKEHCRSYYWAEEKEELINFLLLADEYDESQLQADLDPEKIRQDYNEDHDRIYSDDSLNKVEKSLALKELVHMSICQVVNDIDLFFTRPYDLTPEEVAEKNRQEAKALENEMQLS